MPTDYSKYPPNWKTEIRPSILKRAGHRCEWCGVPNYGLRRFNTEIRELEVPGGNLDLDRIAVEGASSYKEAKFIAGHWNEACNDGNGKWIVIVLTIAHVHNPDPMDCREENLAALCQRCHNGHDAPMRAKNRKKKTKQLEIWDKKS